MDLDAFVVGRLSADLYPQQINTPLEDVRWLGTHPTLKTALAFCEAWPPDTSPITFYREPTCPDRELRLAERTRHWRVRSRNDQRERETEQA